MPTFTTDSYWTCPLGITSINVKLIGVGANGLSGSGSGGGFGGGAGAYSEANVTVIPEQVYSIIIPAVNSGNPVLFRNAENIIVRATSANGTAGGAANGCIGTIKRSGGNGNITVSNNGKGGGGVGTADGNGAVGGNTTGGLDGTGNPSGGNGGSVGFIGSNAIEAGAGGGGMFSGSSNGCCGDIIIPEILQANISNQTGSCTCLVGPFQLTHSVDTETTQSWTFDPHHGIGTGSMCGVLWYLTITQ
jgi:hypothetical protein